MTIQTLANVPTILPIRDEFFGDPPVVDVSGTSTSGLYLVVKVVVTDVEDTVVTGGKVDVLVVLVEGFEGVKGFVVVVTIGGVEISAGDVVGVA